MSSAPAKDSPLLVCGFHFNLAFSSLRTDRQPEVIERCYWPMLALAERTPFPIAFEASGWTLERIAEHDPEWIERARELIAAGRAEFIGSGYSQCAAPLLPAEANRWNLRLGMETYERILGERPRVALFGEQAYSPGLVEIYLEAGFEICIVDWDNAYRSNLDWETEVRRHPQRALGTGGATIPIAWSESIAFQKFQRFVHDEMSLERYVEFVAGSVTDGGALLLYANDAEVFDFRPGRFAAEPKPKSGEWDRIAAGLNALADAGIGRPALPSEVLGLIDSPGAGRELRLEAPDQPIPVKKQDKYNPTRWAVTGRDDIGINTRCRRIYERLISTGTQDPDAWRTLCTLWASDFRTHITDDRWEDMQTMLALEEERLEIRAPVPLPPPGAGAAKDLPEVSSAGPMWRIRIGRLDVTLNARRGLSIDSFADTNLGGDPLLGTIEHGYFQTIALGADWYSGNLIQEAPLRHKITDLEPMDPVFERVAEQTVRAFGRLETELGAIEKVITIDGARGVMDVDTTLRWAELPLGSLRAANIVLRPEAFDPLALYYATHNGGDQLERQELAGMPAFDHGSPVSSLVSARQCLGATEGILLLGDLERTVRLEIDQLVCSAPAMIRLHPDTDHFFFRAALSLTESDETRRGPIGRSPEKPQRVRFSLSAARTEDVSAT